MEGNCSDKFQKAAKVLVENADSVCGELSAKCEALQSKEEELAEMKREVPALKGEVEDLRRELSSATEERDGLTAKLALAENTNLELKRALENMVKKFGSREEALPSTSSSSITDNMTADTATSKEKIDGDGESLTLDGWVGNPSTEAMDSEESISSEQPAIVTTRQCEPALMSTKSLGPVLPEASSSTSKPRPMARTKSTPRRGQNMAEENKISEQCIDELGSLEQIPTGLSNEQESFEASSEAEIGTVDNSQVPNTGPSTSSNVDKVAIAEHVIPSSSKNSRVHGVDPLDHLRCLCGNRYKRGSKSFQNHLDYYAGRWSRTCGVCGKKLANSQNYKLHIRKIHNINGSIATLPGRITRNSLKKTSGVVVKRDDTASPVDRFLCSRCPAILIGLNDLTAHFDESHMELRM